MSEHLMMLSAMMKHFPEMTKISGLRHRIMYSSVTNEFVVSDYLDAVLETTEYFQTISSAIERFVEREHIAYQRIAK